MSSYTAINTSTTFDTTDGSPFFTAHSTGDGQYNSILANWPVSFKNTVNTDAISTGIGGPLTSFLKNTMTDFPSELPNSPTLEEPTFMSSEAQIDIKPTTNYSHVNSQNAAPEEEEREFEQPQPRSLLPDPEDPPVTIDWDPDATYQTRFWNRIMIERRRRQEELLLIEQQRQELNIERQQIAQIRSIIDQQKYDLEVRQNKMIEYESLIPSARELRNCGISLELILPYLSAINEKAVAEVIDLKTSANNLVSCCLKDMIIILQ